ncbi:hypothetical protein CPHLJ_2g885 [Cryptosporidium parvum]|uniref:Roadblock/LAMTOR2 domain-containing protein n=1 Tax=Cryptosporidium parvum TaxID=5807 RepID=A0A7S7LJ49_CRYPV|nr:hypothetical protein CPATCC_0029960 [Cryptosporidium parvum]WKS76383.1 hypothetical protein CPCDC_2g885 [Cryptosporidium sp. 43IA8]WRK30876.1 hypothetical protein cpbgf_200883 [Cryptosporidium parvum]|eukprot:QOY43145.1 hypothetical protein CPATCC_000858 [Cryptosporidium parvum]
MSSTYEILKNSPGFIGMASFTKTGLPIQEYGSKHIKHEVSEFCSTITQIRSSLSSSILSENISITIETTKKKIITVESNDIILILYKNNDPKVSLGNSYLDTDAQS